MGLILSVILVLNCITINMELYIKNMVCPRCIMIVKYEIHNLGFATNNIQLGKVSFYDQLDNTSIEKIRTVLNKVGFDIISDRNKQLVEKIKTIVIEKIHHSENELPENFLKFIENQLHLDYKYLSNIFSKAQGITLEKFIILQKIEKVKELLEQHSLTLSEISYRLGYSEVSHLSSQFKRIAGITPSNFKKLKNKDRKPLDNLSD